MSSNTIPQNEPITKREMFLTHFESAIEPGKTLPVGQLQTMYEGRPIWARYDLDSVKHHMTKSVLAGREKNIWRYRELLPVGRSITPVSLDESFSPLIDCPKLAAQLGIRQLIIKDESRLATGSFKSRGLSMAMSMAKHFGLQRVAMSSNGNAGGAMSMYAARAGIKAVVFMPSDTPRANILECIISGASVLKTNGLIDENGKHLRKGHELGLWFDISTMKEPYRLEGKKTIGLELAEQFDWELPDAILFPTGGGTALIGMWKAFQELKEMGFLNSSRMPKMICCQTDGCCPLFTAYKNGERFANRHDLAKTIASGIRVPAAIGDFMVLDAVQESQGVVTAADERRLIEWQRTTAEMEGFIVCPETATCIGALDQLTADGTLSSTDRVVVFNTAVAQKYFDDLEIDVPLLDIYQDIDWNSFESKYLTSAH